MISQFQTQRPTFAYRFLSAIIAITFIFSVIAPPAPVYAQLFPQGLSNLPLPGAMVPVSPGFTPPLVTGITIHPDNPLEFDFIVSTGDDQLEGKVFEDESTRLIKYFLAALTVPEEEMWVNLSPYEEDRVIPEGFGDTEMGRDLLAQDYLLKQLTASLMYPEDELGEKFWTKVRTKAYEKFGTTEIPMNTFNKVWIVPEEALVYEHGKSAFVIKSHLKVMLEEDYLALQKNKGVEKYGLDSIVQDDAEIISGISSEVVREVLIPEIEKEVNTGETFANLRQIYNSVILASWYKQNLMDGLLGQVYIGKNKTAGVDTQDKQVNQKIYDQYLDAFKKGVYNYIREDYDPATEEVIPRKYFSGGMNITNVASNAVTRTIKSSSPLSGTDLTAVTRYVSSPVETKKVNWYALEYTKDSGLTPEDVIEIAKPAKASSPITGTFDVVKTSLQDMVATAKEFGSNRNKPVIVMFLGLQVAQNTMQFDPSDPASEMLKKIANNVSQDSQLAISSGSDQNWGVGNEIYIRPASSSPLQNLISREGVLLKYVGDTFADQKNNGLVSPEVTILRLTGKGDPNEILRDPRTRTVLETAVSQGLASILFAGQGKDGKEVGDGNAVAATHRNLLRLTQTNRNEAAVVLADEGARDNSYSLELNRIYYSGYEGGYKDFADKASRDKEILRLRSEEVHISYSANDALEHTNALVKNIADSWGLAALANDDIVNGTIRKPVDDNSRIAGISFNAPNNGGVNPLDLPSVALPKIAIANGFVEGTEAFDSFINSLTLVVLGPRAKKLEKESTQSDSHRHKLIINDMKAMKKVYKGLKIYTPGDGDFAAGLVALTGADLDGRKMVAFGRHGSAEATILTFSATVIPGAQFSHRIVSEKATAKLVSPENADKYTEAEIKQLTDYGYTKDDYMKSFTSADTPGRATVAMSAVTGASEEQFGKTMSGLLGRINFDEENNTVTVNTLLITLDGSSFIVKTKFKAEDVTASKVKLVTASRAAREFLKGRDISAQDFITSATEKSSSPIELGNPVLDQAGIEKMTVEKRKKFNAEAPTMEMVQRMQVAMPRAGGIPINSSVLFDLDNPAASSPIAQKLEPRDFVPQHRDSSSEDLFLKKYEKIYPETKSFLQLYGGKNKNYSILRELAEYMSNNVDIFIDSATKDPYVDIIKAKGKAKQQIRLNRKFVDFFNKSGRKKLFMALMASSLYKAKYGFDANTNELEILVTSKQASLISNGDSRLKDLKRLYELQKTIEHNDTFEGVLDPYYLTDDDIVLVISDTLHRGKILDARRLWETLRGEYGAYGEISREKAEELLHAFYSANQGKIEQRKVVIEDNIEQWKAKLDDNAKIVNEGIAEGGSSKVITAYNLRASYQEDPALADRWFIWDVEVEKVDEVFIGGKSGNTGEMVHAQHAVTLPSFFSNGTGFQKLYEFNDAEKYLPHLKSRIIALEEFIGKHSAELDMLVQDVDKDIQVKLGELGVNLDDLDTETPFALAQAKEALEGLRIVQSDFEENHYANLRDYFKSIGDMLDADIREIKGKETAINNIIRGLKAGIKQYKDDSSRVESVDRWQEEIEVHEKTKAALSLGFEERAKYDATRLLAAARIMLVPEDFKSELKEFLRSLAIRLDIPVSELLLAIRSSMAGEDSEEASFAGRQDSNFFRRPYPTKSDPEGLDFIVRELVFNQASLFNKRSITYRLGLPVPLPTFDETIRISTVFQDMFMSEIAFTSFSVDRVSGFPIMDVQLTEGQGDIMVSGTETGGALATAYDGTILARIKGERKNMFIEKRDDNGNIIGRMTLEIPESVRNEHVITDQTLIRESSKYFRFLHEFYGPQGYVDLEGAWRKKEDKDGNPIPLTDKGGKVLLDERGLPRWQWQIVSTQARPETVHTGRDSDNVPLKMITVTDQAFKKAQQEGRVLPIKFLAKINGASQGKAIWVDKTPESLASTEGKIMLTEQSDPDMNDAMVKARGIIAFNGGQNSHTMVVASEYDLNAMTGVIGIPMEEVQKLIPNGTEITMDAKRGVVLLGIDHELQIIGEDFNVRTDIPDPVPPFKVPEGMRFADAIRSSTIVGSTSKAFVQWAMSRIPSYKGIGLERLELALAAIGIYPEALLGYDNYLKRKNGESYDAKIDGPILHARNDRKLIEEIEKAIKGYNSGKDFYISILSEWLQATSETLIAPKVEAVVAAQKIKNPSLRLKVLGLVNKNYELGLGYEQPLNELKKIFNSRVGKDRFFKKGSDEELIHTIIGLLDKRLYIRLDDRKSDEYGAVLGATRFIKDEVNPMKGKRGLDYMLGSPTLSWQLEAIRKVAAQHRTKFGVFAPIVRRPEDMKELLDRMDKAGLTKDLIKRGMMTELPTNAINIMDYLATGIDFISTGGNDLLQTVGAIDRLTNNENVKNAVNAYDLMILRANALLAGSVKAYNKANGTHIEAGFCGNDPSVDGQENYSAILSIYGYNSVSVILEAYQRVATLLADKNPDIAQEIKDIAGFTFDIDPTAILKAVDEIDYTELDVKDVRMGLGVHYRALKEYDDLMTAAEGDISSFTINSEQQTMLSGVRAVIERENRNTGMGYYKKVLRRAVSNAASSAKRKGKNLVIGTDHGMTGEYSTLTFGDMYESDEANQDFGYAGLVRSVGKNREDESFLRADIEVIQELSKEFDNLEIALKKVRSYRELKDGLAIVKEIAPKVPVKIDVLVPGNIFEAKEMMEQEGVNSVSISDPEGLTSELYALEKNNNNGVRITDEDIEYQLRLPIAVLATQAMKNNKKLYVKGIVPIKRILAAFSIFEKNSSEENGKEQSSSPVTLDKLRNAIGDLMFAHSNLSGTPQYARLQTLMNKVVYASHVGDLQMEFEAARTAIDEAAKNLKAGISKSSSPVIASSDNFLSELLPMVYETRNNAIAMKAPVRVRLYGYWTEEFDTNMSTESIALHLFRRIKAKFGTKNYQYKLINGNGLDYRHSGNDLVIVAEAASSPIDESEIEYQEALRQAREENTEAQVIKGNFRLPFDKALMLAEKAAEDDNAPLPIVAAFVVANQVELQSDNVRPEVLKEIKERLQGNQEHYKEFIQLDNGMKMYGRVSNAINKLDEALRGASSPVKADERKVGGINLNPELLDLQIKRDGNGIPLPMNMQPIREMRIDGFIPVIINVTPVVNLPLLLGFAEDGSPVNTAGGTQQRTGFDLSLIDKYRNKYVVRIESENDIDA